ncbi:hypothetical protein PGT21_034823 [Puccinia graminis f. sp. tritici]|uniref:Uncharacterized protein n=1 Tax=Puccinia graminis f. sp. tritici TaxID=56615 RepID=A0A5B0SLN7_PUCGR|nr:hypothetical protein PGT21_034823 [Puccinia graminis f. sp. tritici]KAA1138279.1 hypothetical protein PGTUg99_028844 [Puccinia graminis f. sp. tritici]
MSQQTARIRLKEQHGCYMSDQVTRPHVTCTRAPRNFVVILCRVEQSQTDGDSTYSHRPTQAAVYRYTLKRYRCDAMHRYRIGFAMRYRCDASLKRCDACIYRPYRTHRLKRA